MDEIDKLIEIIEFVTDNKTFSEEVFHEKCVAIYGSKKEKLLVHLAFRRRTDGPWQMQSDVLFKYAELKSIQNARVSASEANTLARRAINRARNALWISILGLAMASAIGISTLNKQGQQLELAKEANKASESYYQESKKLLESLPDISMNTDTLKISVQNIRLKLPQEDTTHIMPN